MMYYKFFNKWAQLEAESREYGSMRENDDRGSYKTN